MLQWVSGHVTRVLKYQNGWSEEFRTEADIDFVVEGQCLPVHSTMLSQSNVLRSAIYDTKNEGRIQLQSPFMSASICAVDDLLSQIYTSGCAFPGELSRSKSLMDLAMRLGFDQLVEIGLQYIQKYNNLDNLRKELDKLNVEAVCWWIRVVQPARKTSTYKVVTQFLVDYYTIILGDYAEPKWNAAKAEISRDMYEDMTKRLHVELESTRNTTVRVHMRCANRDCLSTYVLPRVRVSELVKGLEISGYNYKCSRCSSDLILQ